MRITPKRRAAYIRAGTQIRDTMTRFRGEEGTAHQAKFDEALTFLCRSPEIDPAAMVRRIVGTREDDDFVCEDTGGTLWAAIPAACATLDAEAAERRRPATVKIHGEDWHTDGYNLWRPGFPFVSGRHNLTDTRKAVDGQDVTDKVPAAFPHRLTRTKRPSDWLGTIYEGAVYLRRPDGAAVAMPPAHRALLKGRRVEQADGAESMLRVSNIKGGVVAYCMPMRAPK